MRTRLAALVVTAVVVLASLPTPSIAAGTTPALAIADVAVTEPSGRNGSAAIVVPVVLDQAPTSPVTVAWRTVFGTAGSSDVVAGSGSATIAAGSQSASIGIAIRADRDAESTESFTVELSTASGATIADGIGLVTIRDASTGLAVGDVTVLEPDAGAADVGITITVPSAPSKAVTFSWTLRSASATLGSDVVAASGTGTIAKGSLSTIVPVRLLGDATVEGDEVVELVVSAVKNVALADGLGAITLRTDDVAPPTPSPTPTPRPTPTASPTPSPTPTPTPTATPTPTPSPTPTPTPSFPDATVPPGLAGWAPPAGSIPATGSVVYLSSSPGDYIGQGRDYAYTRATSVLEFDDAGDRFSVHIRGDESWDGWFVPRGDGQPLTTGAYAWLLRYPFFTPGLSWAGEGRGCNTLYGHLLIDEVVRDGAGLVRLVARFDQRCTSATNPPLYGYLRYERDDPTVPPGPGDAADFSWTPPTGSVPGSGDYLYVTSEAGDWIGQGATVLYTPANATFGATEASGVIRVRVDEAGGRWDVAVSGPDAQTRFLPGLYAGLGRYPFHNPVEGGLDVSAEGRGCARLAGAFAVDEVSYDALGLVSLSVRFEQRCEETGPPLRGALRWTRP